MVALISPEPAHLSLNTIGRARAGRKQGGHASNPLSPQMHSAVCGRVKIIATLQNFQKIRQKNPQILQQIPDQESRKEAVFLGDFHFNVQLFRCHKYRSQAYGAMECDIRRAVTRGHPRFQRAEAGASCPEGAGRRPAPSGRCWGSAGSPASSTSEGTSGDPEVSNTPKTPFRIE